MPSLFREIFHAAITVFSAPPPKGADEQRHTGNSAAAPSDAAPISESAKDPTFVSE